MHALHSELKSTPRGREEHMKKLILALALVASVAAVAVARRAIKQAEEDKRAKDQSAK